MIKIILFSGYFVNKKELLKEYGIIHGSEKDILAAGFEKKGSAFFAELNGLFSFVILDKENDTLYCCRDRFGGRGLYYAFDKEGKPIFSEKIKELVRMKNEPACFNVDMLEVYLSYSYIPGEETAIKDIWKPLPGYFYCFKKGSVTKERYFTPRYSIENRTEDEWERVLTDTLDEIFCSYEQNGASMLSSGIDSSYICKRISACDTYTASYDDDNFSEAEQARRFSIETGANNHAVNITPQAYLDTVPEAMLALEQPSSDVSVEAMMILLKEINRKHEFCYSGEGADELFMGYYMDDARNADRGISLYEAGYIGTTAALSEEEKKRLLKHYKSSRKMEYTKEAYAFSSEEDNLCQAAMVDMLVWLNGNLLPAVSGLAGHVGLNILTPYLDNRLYDIILNMPSSIKNDEFLTKKIFRKVASGVIGNDNAKIPKRGFPVPITDWIRLPEYVKQIRQAFMSDTAFRFFNTEELISFYNEMLSNTEDTYSWRKIWCIYCFIVWYDEMINPYYAVPRWQVYDEKFNRTEAWNKKDYPDSEFSYMRQAGCLVVSIATMLRLHGIVEERNEELFNPMTFLEEVKGVKGLTSAADLNLDALQDIYPIKYLEEEKYTQNRLAELMESGEMCLVRVTGFHDSYHFVVPTKIEGDDVEIIDSGWNYEKLSCFEKAYSILRFIKIVGDRKDGKSMPPEERIIHAALSYDGVRESSLDANDVIFNTHYYGQQVCGPDYPWCVAFEWDIFRECGLSTLFYDGKKTASCIELYRWGKETGRLIDYDKGKRGDIALYDWYEEGKPVHTGIILGDYCKEHYRTIEGNTTDPTDPDDICGRVMVQKRRFGGIFAIIRPDYNKTN